MSKDDLEGRLSAWLAAEAPERASGRLRASLDARLDKARQSHRWVPIVPRPPLAPRTAALLATLAVVGTFLVLAIAGSLGGGPPQVPPSVAAPSPTASPTPARSPDRSPSPEGVLLPAGENATTVLNPPVRFAVPAGWTKSADLPAQLELVPPGAGVFEQPDHSLAFDNVGVYVHPLAGPPDGGPLPLPGIGTDAKALSNWLSTRPQVIATKPAAVTIGRLSGYTLDFSVSGSAGSLCGVPCVNLFNARDPGPAYQLGLFQGEQARGYLLDLPGGGVILVLIEDVDGQEVAKLRATAHSVVDSFTFQVTP